MPRRVHEEYVDPFHVHSCSWRIGGVAKQFPPVFQWNKGACGSLRLSFREQWKRLIVRSHSDGDPNAVFGRVLCGAWRGPLGGPNAACFVANPPSCFATHPSQLCFGVLASSCASPMQASLLSFAVPTPTLGRNKAARQGGSCAR